MLWLLTLHQWSVEELAIASGTPRLSFGGITKTPPSGGAQTSQTQTLENPASGGATQQPLVTPDTQPSGGDSSIDLLRNPINQPSSSTSAIAPPSASNPGGGKSASTGDVKANVPNQE